MITAYRVFKVHKDGSPTTLFHGWYGSKKLPLDAELEAVRRLVTNPGKKDSGRKFISGWHVVTDGVGLMDYVKRFKRREELVVCKVGISGLRSKPGSKVLLADTMIIHSSDWRRALAAHKRLRRTA